jgi:cation diffusion facilitator family transporter
VPPSDANAVPAPSAPSGSLRVVLAALTVNVLIACFKFTVALLSGSAGMFAEALHSLADTGNQIFLLMGIRLASRAADEEHPFGYGSEQYFWAFLAGLFIFAVGGALSIYEGVHKLSTRAVIDRPLWAVVVLGGSFLFEGCSFTIAFGELRSTRAGRTLRDTIRETRDPTVLTVLFEDAADLFGLAVALAGVLLSTYLHQPMWDALASIVVGVLLGGVAAVLLRNAKSLLIGRSVPESERARIEAIARAARDVLDVVHIRTVHLGPNEVMVGLKLSFEPSLDVRTLEVRINELEASLRAALPHLRRIYVEPGFDERALRARTQHGGQP